MGVRFGVSNFPREEENRQAHYERRGACSLQLADQLFTNPTALCFAILARGTLISQEVCLCGKVSKSAWMRMGEH